MLARISKDENLHMVFYRNIVAAALEIAPDETMRAIADEVIGFEMPGATMAGFRRSSMIIAKAGIYDIRLHHDEVIMPILRHWDVFDRTDLGAVGEQARDELAGFLERLDAQATTFVDRRAEGRARAAATVRDRRGARHRLLRRPCGQARGQRRDRAHLSTHLHGAHGDGTLHRTLLRTRPRTGAALPRGRGSTTALDTGGGDLGGPGGHRLRVVTESDAPSPPAGGCARSSRRSPARPPGPVALEGDPILSAVAGRTTPSSTSWPRGTFEGVPGHLPVVDVG